MKKPIDTMLILILSLVIFIGFAVAQDPAEDEINFKWGVVAFTTNSPAEVVDVQAITKNIVLKSDQFLRCFLQPENKTFMYLFWINKNGEISMLYPDNNKMFGLFYIWGYPKVVPRKLNGFALAKHKGENNLIMLAASYRLQEIEQLYRAYKKNQNKADLEKQLWYELQKMQKWQRKYTSTEDDYDSIAGSYRSPVKIPNFEKYLTHIKARNVYYYQSNILVQ